MHMGMEVNADSGCCWVPSTSRPLRPRPRAGRRSARVPPSRLAHSDPNFPGSRPAIRRRGLALSPALPESWVARGWFPSPPFPDPNRDVSGSAWEGPDLPGPGGGNRAAMTASFRFLAFPSCAPSSRSPLALPEGLPLWPRTGRGESRLFPAGGPPLPPGEQCGAPCPQVSHSPDSAFPRAHSPRAARSRPRKEPWNGSPTPEFPVFLSGDKRRGCGPIAAPDAPPAARASPWALRGRIQDREGALTAADSELSAGGGRRARVGGSSPPVPPPGSVRSRSAGESWVSKPHLPRTSSPRTPR